jgi:hypothetical protein
MILVGRKFQARSRGSFHIGALSPPFPTPSRDQRANTDRGVPNLPLPYTVNIKLATGFQNPASRNAPIVLDTAQP